MPIKSNIILIGMAGCGKSTIGKMLATQLSCNFVDTDIMLEEYYNVPLQELVDQAGPDEFRRREEKLLLSLQLSGTVIATGGSSAYSNTGMEHLRKSGVTVYLDTDLSVLKKRVKNESTRGLVRQPDQGFSDLYSERIPLYLKHADYLIKCGEMTGEDICLEIIEQLCAAGSFK